MPTKVFIWGIGRDFQVICNQLRLNEECGNIEITAFISKDSNARCLDGKKVIGINDVIWGGGYNGEYIIVATDRYYGEIVSYGSNILGIDRKKFINGKVFQIPCFDWKRYMQIYESNISIVAEMCYGGILSHDLGLPFNSPFVNVRIGLGRGDYDAILSELDKYMSIAPQMQNTSKYVQRDWIGLEGRVDFPKLWYGDVMLHGFHFSNQEEFYAVWEKRRKRFNHSQKFILKVLYDEKDVETFKKLPFQNKLGFYFNKTDCENIICLDWKHLYEKYAYQFAGMVLDYIRSGAIYRDIDIFRALCGEDLFQRKQETD